MGDQESVIYISRTSPTDLTDHTAENKPIFQTMDDKFEAIHVEEQSTHEGDRTNTQLLTDNGIVLIPQPTADPNGTLLSALLLHNLEHD